MARRPTKPPEKVGPAIKRKPGGRRDGAGRKKGVPNKLTVETKEAIKMAFEGIGGVPNLVRWARENEGPFYERVWTKLLPLEVTGKNGGPVRLSFENQTDEELRAELARLIEQLKT